MEDLMARTEIHDACAGVALAESLLAKGKYQDATAVMLEAEGHYRNAQSATTFAHSGSTIDRLADLRVKLDQVRSAIRRKSGTLERHA